MKILEEIRAKSLAFELQWEAGKNSSRRKTLHDNFTVEPCDISEEPCIVWTGALNTYGYGVFARGPRHARNNFFVHRLVYTLFSPDWDQSLEIDHLCRRRACFNPRHLEPVTTSENTRRGLSAKLSPQKIEWARGRLAGGETRGQIADDYGVTKSALCYALRGDTWA